MSYTFHAYVRTKKKAIEQRLQARFDPGFVEFYKKNASVFLKAITMQAKEHIGKQYFPGTKFMFVINDKVRFFHYDEEASNALMCVFLLPLDIYLELSHDFFTKKNDAPFAQMIAREIVHFNPTEAPYGSLLSLALDMKEKGLVAWNERKDAHYVHMNFTDIKRFRHHRRTATFVDAKTLGYHMWLVIGLANTKRFIGNSVSTHDGETLSLSHLSKYLHNQPRIENIPEEIYRLTAKEVEHLDSISFLHAYFTSCASIGLKNRHQLISYDEYTLEKQKHLNLFEKECFAVLKKRELQPTILQKVSKDSPSSFIL